MYIYTVRKGDSPGKIERRFKMERGSLRAINGLSDPARLCPGLALLLPGEERPPSKRRELWLGCSTALPSPPVGLPAAGDGLMLLKHLNINEEDLPESPVGMADNYGAKSMPRLYFERPALLKLISDGDWSESLAGALKERLCQDGHEALLIDLSALSGLELSLCNGFIGRLSGILRPAALRLALALAMEGADGAGIEQVKCFAGLCDRMIFCPPPPSGRFEGPEFHEGRLLPRLDRLMGHLPGEKCLLLCPTMGRDYGGDGRRRRISMAAAADTACALATEVYFDRAAKTAFFDYSDPTGIRHRVWFEDVRSLESRCGLVEEYGLAGLVFDECEGLSQAGLELLCRRLDP